MSSNASRQPMLSVSGLAKTFVLHTRGALEIPVFDSVSLEVLAGECLVLTGPSGSGKSTLLRSLYANYKPSAGTVLVWHDGAWLDLTAAIPRQVFEVRKRTVGYVSQFLRVIPRISALDLVAQAALEDGGSEAAARERAGALLGRLNVPEQLWSVPPATFSGGEQQRINIARCLVRDYPVLLLDEPTASLDPQNCGVVIELIREARARGSAVVGIFHDPLVRRAVGTREFEVARFKPGSPRVSAGPVGDRQ